ncbi:UrcA family protein [Porphyrobacter sp. LM 6]|jgi:UrcA family protein|uniref:UrcA family protein n=1 Tax=Porphyrobacter sp. LM 6 TaxID=1896196 RepID=UPI000863947B|nr:UrcA family protein [Porphyrobacter sp. LM 6]AOL93359.1 UrcA family protein [Porphyrobacter sp. LM 6]
MKPLAMTLAAIGLAGTAISPAFAGKTETMTIHVPTADINLATPEGQKRLDQRLEKAARTVCRTDSLTTGSRILSQESRECLAKARSDSKQQVAALMNNEQRGG